MASKWQWSMFFRQWEGGEELTGRDIRRNIGEEKDDQGEDDHPGRRVDPRVGLHELPEGARNAGLVEAIHGDERPTEEEQQWVGDLKFCFSAAPQ